jgi:hypothetical protein
MDRSDLEKQKARQSAAAAFAALPDQDITEDVGQPQRVFTPNGKPSYWLVAGLKRGQVQAVARIRPDGRVATVGPVKGFVTDSAQATTGLSASMASRLRSDLLSRHPESRVSRPMLVHDGPVGREAWLYRVRLKSGEELWIFATGGGLYSRKAGESQSQTHS